MISQFRKYLKYKLGANSSQSIKSPFVQDLISKVLEDEETYYAYTTIELMRKKLLLNPTTIHVEDMGAGSRVFKTNDRKIGDITKYSAKSEKYAQLLFRLVNYFQPDNVIELGTSVGVSTCYLAKAKSKCKVYTLEGSKEICKVAASTFKTLKINNVKLIEGNFDQTLPQLVQELDQLDMVYFDGNHQKEPTLRYFEICLEKKHKDSIFIFDDIHWSEEMEEAWEEIKQHPEVLLTIDLFHFGLVFFKEGSGKEHLALKF